jgi:hypothetical protein
MAAVGGAIEGAPDYVGEMDGAEAVRRYLQDWIEMFDNVTNIVEEPARSSIVSSAEARSHREPAPRASPLLPKRLVCIGLLAWFCFRRSQDWTLTRPARRRDRHSQQGSRPARHHSRHPL